MAPRGTQILCGLGQKLQLDGYIILCEITQNTKYITPLSTESKNKRWTIIVPMNWHHFTNTNEILSFLDYMKLTSRGGPILTHLPSANWNRFQNLHLCQPPILPGHEIFVLWFMVKVIYRVWQNKQYRIFFRFSGENGQIHQSISKICWLLDTKYL